MIHPRGGRNRDRELSAILASEGYTPGVPGGLLVEELLPDLEQALSEPCSACGSKRIVPRCFARGRHYAVFVLCARCGQASER